MSKPVVCVEWIDAEQDPQWIAKDEIAKIEAPIVKSYGVIMRRDNKVLILAHSIVGDSYGCNTIPAGMVRKVTRL